MAIKDSGERTTFETGAQRDMHAGKGRFDLLPWEGIHELAKLCEEGAVKYGEHNVDKGIPQHSLIDSCMRHLKKHIMGETDEDHLRAAAWNIMWALQQRKTHPELIDVPWNGKRDTWRDSVNIKIANAQEATAEHLLTVLGKFSCRACIYQSGSVTEPPCSECIHCDPDKPQSQFCINWDSLESLAQQP